MDNSRREFALIERFFRHRGPVRRDVRIHAGDDAAVLAPPPQSHIAVTTDTMVAGVHFDHHLSPHAIGHKLVTVNMSDLAAMGAEPAWASLALTLPEYDETWLEGFTEGLFAALDFFNCALVGGDITRGPMTLTITAQGLLPNDRALTRSGAQPGDTIFVSGTLGDAALALALQHDPTAFNANDTQRDALEKRLFYPTARVMLGTLIRNQASSAIDLSDGLGGDLTHILSASKVGARIHLDALPASAALDALVQGEARWKLQLFGGDDYELCFTVPQSRLGVFETMSKHAGVAVSPIGVIEKEPGLRFEAKKKQVEFTASSYSHF
ncbi:thiamine-phosphate kinase [Aliidiomarina sanyensis]|uniref:Thiamine-monophosphate kinase n=1 Tax=Aliidiomarina sanyensis TaxID=1249555 RepID=A0A432WBG1_9GAMM|nr:thiamine-phosphate kinase [Aliidiomarina sanyensis]RUO29121.1 thiamine-phosphate kinase [Aliidiomarina sanyensis]